MSNQRNNSNLVGFFWLVLWTVLTVPFIGPWSFVFPVGLFLHALWKCEQIDREKLRNREWPYDKIQ